MTISTLFIPNRGEIVRRISRTARSMGIRVAVAFTRQEACAPHVVEADVAHMLTREGAAAYLDIASLIEAARATGADAVHPGYGFLAESASFARAVVEAGLTWVGPPPDAIAQMGNKLEAKGVAVRAGVPILKSIEVSDESSISLPALVKAAAGGGGKGMRVVRRREDLAEAIASSRREAETAFGDGQLFIEPYIERARHVEIQVLGDSHGHLLHLGERECSIQRRHQKIVEESPSPVVDRELRNRMGEAALSLAQAIGYRNAGTVEFLLADDGRFFFLEMNTRLQVEHPVTEEVTGVDLVCQQLLEASGEPLEIETTDTPVGHAIEVRLNAENVQSGFLPAAGVLVGWRPAEDLARVESGVEAGSVVSTDFDPLLAKFVSSARTRKHAALRLALALERSVIQGVETNREMLSSLLRSKEFLAGDTTTDFLQRVSIPTRRELSRSETEHVLAAAVREGERRSRESARVLQTLPSGWRNGEMPRQQRIYQLRGVDYVVRYTADAGGGLIVSFGVGDPGKCVPRVDSNVVTTSYRPAMGFASSVWVHGPWGDIEVLECSPFPSSNIDEPSGSLVSPMPGRVVSVGVSVGDVVKRGQTLIVLEAMKMEHAIASSEDGLVADVKVTPGQQIERGAVLVIVVGDEE